MTSSRNRIDLRKNFFNNSTKKWSVKVIRLAILFLDKSVEATDSEIKLGGTQIKLGGTDMEVVQVTVLIGHGLVLMIGMALEITIAITAL